MADNNPAGLRTARLLKTFRDSLEGKLPIKTENEGKLFLEAICVQKSPSICVEKIIASAHGLESIQRGVRVSTSVQFISLHVFPFLKYISHPDVKSLCEGTFLDKILSAVVEPPTVWKSMLHLCQQNDLLIGQSDVTTFAWLCLEIVRSPSQDLAAAASDVIALWDHLAFMKHPCHAVREAGYRIQKIIHMKSSGNCASSDINGPGGRHDNDFADYRQISVLPTSDEFASSQRSFYRTASEVEKSAPEERCRSHLDNQFRLLREDMLSELREDVQIALGQKKSHRRVQKLGNLYPVGIHSGDEHRGRTCSLVASVGSGLEVLKHKTNEQRKRYLTENFSLLKQSFGALYSQHEVIGFAYIFRDIDKLAQDTPVVELQFTTTDEFSRALAAFEKYRGLNFVVVDTPIFAYQPVLERLKCIVELPLEAQLLGPFTEKDSTSAKEEFVPSQGVLAVVEACRNSAEKSTSLQVGDCTYEVDYAQRAALVNALTRSLSVTQGPPGTGKSYIGALGVKILLSNNPTSRILVLAYTNHALDQSLNDLLSLGIDPKTMIRLGSKTSASVAPLSIESQFRETHIHKSSQIHNQINRAKDKIAKARESISWIFKAWATRPTLKDVLGYLEFCHEDQDQLCLSAFTVPYRRRPNIQPEYLIDRWVYGKGPGALSRNVSPRCASIWSINRATRSELMGRWLADIVRERRECLVSNIKDINALQIEVDRLFDQAKCAFVRTKQIIGCTTTAAAKYPGLIKAANPDCVIVEEAGEILEAHILAALSPNVKQLILIGDHKQLRPKCKNYALSVEKGDGYDLNRSLFERLILHRYPHTVLHNQHRMDPSISQLVRSLTYPDLLDDVQTLNRFATRGLTSKVMFVNHGHPEGSVDRLRDAQDDEGTNSKQNEFEARMVIQTVKYLGQQGYKTKDIVVLTPYLGQLRLLRSMLARDNDPLLSDLDSNELVRAGLLTDAAAKVGKSQIRLSTIDNYQGEESDIVIASLTRSNANGDIGFMKAPQRLNVLLSRARNCLIMYGNMETFMASARGRDCWLPFFGLMKKKGFLRDGLEVRCEQHPERRALLRSPEEFDFKCPDGGCSEICNALLKCGQHPCARRCHRVADHSNTPCVEVLQKTCAKRHDYETTCSAQHEGCPKCRKEEEEIRRRAKRDFDLEKARLLRQEQYQRELQAIQDELSFQKLLLKDERDKTEEERILQQHRDDLAGLRETVKRQDAIKKAEQEVERGRGEGTRDDDQKDHIGVVEPGSARDEWECMKREELAQSDILDKLMEMIGLESVKRQFLEVKTTVDTAVRQGRSTKNDRFGCSLLGNPGTGKFNMIHHCPRISNFNPAG
ncbi:hypothetical protein E4U55_002088 [Claviceps digitariae]|nr:hypothetical protein E4U55_002088 [Claviceps digitariae]